MPKKGSARRDADSTRPKQLRKRLRKAEDQLQDAQAKRDRAQARVEALSIIADEIRAQLAAAEQVDESRRAAAAAAKAARPTKASKAANDETTKTGNAAEDGISTEVANAPGTTATRQARKVGARRSASATPKSDAAARRSPARSRSRASGTVDGSDAPGE